MTSARANKSTSLENESHVSKLLGLGANAETLLFKGETSEAQRILKSAIANCKDLSKLDTFLAAKLTLTQLMIHIRMAQFSEALKIWNSAHDQSPWGFGIYALENAQVRVQDLVTYDMVCAFLHSKSGSSKTKSAQAVNLYLDRVCDFAHEQGDRALMVQAIANWKSHFKEIFGSSIPLEAAQLLIQREKEFGETIRPRPIEFSQPGPWTHPPHFRETSTIIEKNKSNSKSATKSPRHAKR